MILIMFIISYTIILTYQFYRYATNMDEELPLSQTSTIGRSTEKSKEIDSDELEDIRNEIRIYTDSGSLDFIEQHM